MFNLIAWQKAAFEHLSLVCNSGVVVDYVSILNTELQKLLGKTISSQQQAKEYLDAIASLSPCDKRKVSCLILRDNVIVAAGVNHNPDNFCCEVDGLAQVTKDSTIHAEVHALSQLDDAANTVLVSNYEPCVACAATILTKGVSNVLSFERGNPANPENLGFGVLANKGIPCDTFADFLLASA